jgi:class 3 adenylate cyclase
VEWERARPAGHARQAARAAPAEQRGGERKLATVVFADLVGSTELAGAEDPERVRVLLERFYDAMAAEVEVAGGTVEKFAGDAVMAAFGAPDALEDHTERALHAALAMQQRLAELFGECLALRIGVNTGEVVVGRPREGSSFVTGDPVNVAARLEQAAAPGEILVGERSVASASGAFEFGEPLLVEAKGKPGGVACRRLGRALSLMRPRGVGGLQTAFVGREAELDALRDAYRRVAAEKRPHLVTVLGEAGVGKTRLAREFWAWLTTESPEPLRRTGRCLHHGRGTTYWALGEILKEHFELLESDQTEAILRRLAGREVLGLTLGLDVASDLHPLVARDRLQDAWIELADELTAEGPAVILVEDLHWAEDELLDLLELLLRAANGPLLLLATARPELLDQRPGWGGARRAATTIELEPLSAADAGQMLDDLLASNLPEHVRRVIVGHGEGNPFFVEELVATLIDRGLLTRRNGSWTVDELPAGFAVPDTVQAVLAARIDLLPPAEKAGLQAASVIGRVFWHGPVYELVPEAPDFRVLEERDFVRRRSGSSIPGETELVFKHQLTREVAYGSLPKARRARLHAAFAAWLERFGGGRDEHAPLLAHHYTEAVRPEDADLAWAGEDAALERLRGNAVRWLRRAAELAAGRYDIDEALDLLGRARALAPRALQAGIWREVAQAHALKYDGEAFWEAAQKAIELSSDERSRAELYSLLAYETTVRLGMWRVRPDRQMVKEWVDRALELNEDETSGRVSALVALSAWDSVHGLEAAHEAVGLAERLGSEELISRAHLVRLEAALASGSDEQALAFARSLLAVLEQTRNPDDREGILWGGALANVACGHIDEAQVHARALVENARELTPHHRIHGIGMSLMVEELAGRWEDIRALTGDAEQAVAENLGTPCTMNARSLLVCALAGAHAGDEDEARRLEASADSLGMQGYGLTIEAPRVRLALVRDDLERVERLLATSTEAMYFARVAAAATRLDALAALRARDAVEEEAPPLLRSNTYLEPFALRALGIVRGDHGLMERALARFGGLGLDWHATETRDLLDS